MKRINFFYTFLYDNFYDKKFHTNKIAYLYQCLLASFIVFIALLLLNFISSELVIASIGSSAFVVFTMPNKQRSKTRYILGGYSVGIFCGISCFYFSIYLLHVFPMLGSYYDELFGAFAVGLSIFCMVIFDLEHPPASAVSLAMVINQWTILTLVVTLAAISVILCFRYLLHKTLIDLL